MITITTKTQRKITLDISFELFKENYEAIELGTHKTLLSFNCLFLGENERASVMIDINSIETIQNCETKFKFVKDTKEKS